MLLYKLVLVVAGRCCLASNDVIELVVNQGSTATLLCPDAKGDVSWTRYDNGKPELLFQDGVSKSSDRRYSSNANNALVISQVKASDSRMYLCNGKHQVYLTVTTDPNIVEDDSPVPDSESDHTENQQPSDWWKILVGVAIGSALVLLAVVTHRLCSAKKEADVEEAAVEVVYEEIGEKLGQDGDCVYSLAQNPLQTGTNH
ncbi:uncharacterized protein LOC125003813 [Mugil cephalus]|uniref:uncharacterized protein LOC125003813 n=1 Tax=Mugil cephalus TaxID=48193 RepID=UPI001FB7088F|nr:uncharacterized protein LOC125003813 [Mugil cephalus]